MHVILSNFILNKDDVGINYNRQQKYFFLAIDSDQFYCVDYFCVYLAAGKNKNKNKDKKNI